MEAATMDTERARHNRDEQFQAAGDELAGMAVERAHRAARAAQEAAPVVTEAAAAQLAETRRYVPAEAAENGMGM